MQTPGPGRAALASEILRVAEVRGSFRLRSGATADRYFDKYRFESDPELLAAIARMMAPQVPSGTELLAGLELGGVPVATALALETGLPALFVRKQAKTYGTARLAEGADCRDRRLCIVEDVVTSGGQIVESASELRGLGGRVESALCVIDREAGGREALAANGIALLPLFTASELEEARST